MSETVRLIPQAKGLPSQQIRKNVRSNPTGGANFDRRPWLLIRLRWPVDSNPTTGANFLDVNQNLHTAINDAATEWGEHISNHAL